MGFLVLGVVALVLWTGRTGAPEGQGEEARSVAGVTPGQEQVQRFWEVYRRATAARVAGEREAAVSLYDAALQLNSAHEDALYYLGNLRFDLGDGAAAERAWRRLVEVNPGSSRAYSQLGMLYACRAYPESFDPGAARAELHRALEINQQETGPHIRLGELELLEGNERRAREHLSAVVGTNSRSAATHFLLGYMAWADGQGREAAMRLREAARAARPAEAVAGVPGEGDTRSGVPLAGHASPCPSLVPELEILAGLPDDGVESVVDSLYQPVAEALADARR
jgi:tetratricopeptide (TPR) repeat protein